MVGAIAQFEREIMLERQREGIAKAKAEGKYKGRAPTARAKADEVLTLLKGGMGATEVAREARDRPGERLPHHRGSNGRARAKGWRLRRSRTQETRPPVEAAFFVCVSFARGSPGAKGGGALRGMWRASFRRQRAAQASEIAVCKTQLNQSPLRAI